MYVAFCMICMKVGFAQSSWGVSLSGASFCFSFLCWMWHNSVNKYCQSASIEITVQCGENESFSYCWELMKWEGSHGSSSILLVMKVKMVLCFVSALSQGYDHTHSHVTFKLLLWRFLWNFIYIYMHAWVNPTGVNPDTMSERERERDLWGFNQAPSSCKLLYHWCYAENSGAPSSTYAERYWLSRQIVREVQLCSFLCFHLLHLPCHFVCTYDRDLARRMYLYTVDKCIVIHPESRQTITQKTCSLRFCYISRSNRKIQSWSWLALKRQS
jgi:hypothetical protein